ncbi:MAG: D-alanine--D-alanine ligase family protein [Bacteroidota bacterium]
MKRRRIAILYGGRSTEHQISILSAQNIIRSIDQERYDIIPIAISRDGTWYLQKDPDSISYNDDPNSVQIDDLSTPVWCSQNTGEHSLRSALDGSALADIDVIWPALHGTYGEDGSIQGLAQIMGIPCVGPGVLGSAVGMDKEVMKRLLEHSGIATAPWITLRRSDQKTPTYSEVAATLGPDVFIKPVNLGSSVGISHVQSEEKFNSAVSCAFEYDTKVIVEKRIHGREVECAVIGNDSPIASLPGEIIPKDGFYSYEAKYIDESGALLVAPAKLSVEITEHIQDLAKKVFTLLECRGLARVDMFLTEDYKLLINEINTMPGFTKISMFPTLWELSGIPPVELSHRLIELAIEAHEIQAKLKG